MAKTPKSSTLPLSEAARHVVHPSGIVATGWPRIEARLADMGVTFDRWQADASKLILARRADGSYASTVGGVVMSVPRQVGKTFMTGALAVALCLEFPGYTVLWTAHRLRTASLTFQTLQGFVTSKRIRPHLAEGRSEGIRRANGEQEILFRNGSRIMFGAREAGFGRGFDAVDLEVFDEAQILTEKALEDMVPATNQSRHPHGALLFFIGTPPRPVDPGEAFTARRTEALSGDADDMVYIEFSADPDADLGDRKQWAKANPSFPSRTPLASMERMWRNLPSEDARRREGLGIWDREITLSVFGEGKWAACRGVVEPRDIRPGAVGVAVSVDLSSSAVVLGARQGDRAVPLPVAQGVGTDWVISAAVETAGEKRVPIVVDAGGPGAFLIPDLKKAARRKGVRVVEATLADMKDACAAIFLQVQSAELLHDGWDQLDAAVADAVMRPVGDRWLWGRRGEKRATAAPDVSLLEAATIALWGQDHVAVRSSVEARLAQGESAVMSI